MTDIVWPRDELVPRNAPLPRLVNPTVMGPPALSGFRQAVASDAGSWVIELQHIPLATRAQVLKWQEIALLTEGAVNPILAPVYVHDRRPHGGFFDGEPDHLPQEDVEAEINVAAALRATTIAINFTYGGPPVPGQFFSVGERLHAIRSIVSQAGTVWTVTIRPGLREVLSGGETAEFNRPVCKCRIVSDMALPLEFNRWGFPSVSFVEDVA